MWSDVISLGADTETVTHGEVLKTTTWTEVYADQMSIRQSEFYEGERVGRRPEIAYKVRTIDYDNEERVKVGTKEYEVMRAYVSSKAPDFTELVLISYARGV